MQSNRSYGFLMIVVVLFLGSFACNLTDKAKSEENSEYTMDDFLTDDSLGIDDEYESYDDNYFDEESGLGDISDSPVSGAEGPTGEGAFETGSSNKLKPVGFVNYGTSDAVVRPWTWIPLGSDMLDTAVSASTVSSANDGIGDWPNSSRFVSLPMGTYTWCIDWEEGDIDEDGNIDYSHYITGEPTVLDENDSDELEFAEEVSINAPPVSAPVYEGKCSKHPIDLSCVGKSTDFQTFVRHINQDPVYPVDFYALANTGFRSEPNGISISVSDGATVWHDGIILSPPDDWIEATTSDSYRAMGVQIFGDMTIGWARVLFDGNQVWEGDTSTAVINASENNGLGWYGVYVEMRCFPPGTHTLRVEASKIKEDVGGWQGGVPIHLFGFKK